MASSPVPTECRPTLLPWTPYLQVSAPVQDHFSAYLSVNQSCHSPYDFLPLLGPTAAMNLLAPVAHICLKHAPEERLCVTQSSYSNGCLISCSGLFIHYCDIVWQIFMLVEQSDRYNFCVPFGFTNPRTLIMPWYIPTVNLFSGQKRYMQICYSWVWNDKFSLAHSS